MTNKGMAGDGQLPGGSSVGMTPMCHNITVSAGSQAEATASKTTVSPTCERLKIDPNSTKPNDGKVLQIDGNHLFAIADDTRCEGNGNRTPEAEDHYKRPMHKWPLGSRPGIRRHIR